MDESELTLEILDQAIKQLPPIRYPKGMKINPKDLSDMVEALEKVADITYSGTFFIADDNIPIGHYEFIW